MNKEKTRKLVIAAMLGAVTIVLGLTPLGFVPLGFINATTMHIPVILAGILEGPIVGACVGLIFGISSMVKAFTMPLPTSFVFWNPLIAIVPRVLVGIVSAYVYKALKDRSPKFLKAASICINIAILSFLGNLLYKIVTADKILYMNLFITLGFMLVFFVILFINIRLNFTNAAVSVAAFLGSMTNTCLVLGGIYLFYATPFMEKIGQKPEMANKFLLGIAGTSGIPEAIVAVIICIVSVSAINKMKKS